MVVHKSFSTLSSSSKLLESDEIDAERPVNAGVLAHFPSF
jgi:hypothetical protein